MLHEISERIYASIGSVQRIFIFYTQHTPTGTAKDFITTGIVFGLLSFIVIAAVNFNNDSLAYDLKIWDKTHNERLEKELDFMFFEECFI